MEPWQVVGTVAAVVFGAIGAWVTVAKFGWDRRDRRAEQAMESEEADRRAHEAERRRREEAQWTAADEEAERDHGFQIYSEAEAREFIRAQPQSTPPVGMPGEPARRDESGRSPRWAYVAAALIVALAVGILWWLLSR